MSDLIEKGIAYLREHPEVAHELEKKFAEALRNASPEEIAELDAYLDRPDVRQWQGAAGAAIAEKEAFRAGERLSAAIIGLDKDYIPTEHHSLQQCMTDGFAFLNRVDPQRKLKHSSTDAEVALAFNVYARQQDIKTRAAFGLEEVRLKLAFLLRWSLNAWPRFRVSHKTAAAMMATPIDPEIVEHIRLPYCALAIAIPSGLLESEKPRTGKMEPLEDISVATFLHPKDHQPMIWRSAHTANGLSLHGYQPISEYFQGQVHRTDEPNEWAHPMTEADDRTNLLISRYIAGVCLAASSPEQLAVRVSRHNNGDGKHKGTHHDQPAL